MQLLLPLLTHWTLGTTYPQVSLSSSLLYRTRDGSQETAVATTCFGWEAVFIRDYLAVLRARVAFE